MKSVGFFYPPELVFKLVRLHHLVVLFRNHLEHALAVENYQQQPIRDLIRSCSRWRRCNRYLLACGILLLPIVTRAQTSTTILEESTSLKRPDAYPIIDGEGNCLAWRTRSEVFVDKAPGQKGAVLAGNYLKVSVSGDGEVFAVLEKLEEKEQPVLRFNWFDRNAQPRGSYRIAWQSDDPLPHFCFNAGATRLWIVDPARAHITNLSGEGQVLREFEMFDNPQYVNERPLFVSANADEFFLLTQELPPVPQISTKPVLICYTSEGQERWRQELAHATGGGLAVSDDGRWILAASYEVIEGTARVNSSLQFFDYEGRLQLTREGLLRQAVFTQDGERVLVLDRRQARLIRLPGGELVWQSNLTSRSEMFVTAAADAGLRNMFALIATSTFRKDRFVFENARLVRFDAAGRVQHATAIAADLIEPALAVTRDGKRLALAAEGVLRSFSVDADNSVTK